MTGQDRGGVVEPGTVVTRAERDQAVEDWLRAAAHDITKARDEWRTMGVALLRCGGIFAAVGIPAELVHAAAGSDEPDAVDAFLRDALHGGPVFTGAYWRTYYALVPASTARHWRCREAECHGVGSYIGVPRPGRTRGEVARWHSYWCVPMDSPGELCEPDVVAELVAAGLAKRRETAEAQGKRASWKPLDSVGVELETAGLYWDAVRVDCPLADRALARLGERSGSAIQDKLGEVVYWLIEPGSADGWDEMSQVKVLGASPRTYVTVPPVRCVDPVGVFWRVPYDSDHYLTDAGVLRDALLAALKPDPAGDTGRRP